MSGSPQIDPKVIEALPPSVLDSTPAAAPPPGVQPDFVSPPTLVPAVLGAGSTFLALALLCFSTRIYTKLVILRKGSWDDFACSLGFLFALSYYITLVLGCARGDVGRHLWDVSLSRLLNSYALAEKYTTTVTSPPALGLIKGTLFIQYYSLFWPLRWVRISVWAGATVSTVFYIAVTVAGFVLNSPWPGQSWIETILSSRYQTFARFSVPIGVIGMLIDLYLVILPIKAVTTLQMSTTKKIGLMVIFLTGAFASVSSIVGLYYRVQVQQYEGDITWLVSYLHIFSQIEMFAGIACACMPGVHQFFRHVDLKTDSLKSLLDPTTSRFSKSRSHTRIPNFSQPTQQTRAHETAARADNCPDGGYELKQDISQAQNAFEGRLNESRIQLRHEISVFPEARTPEIPGTPSTVDTSR